jgi:ATP-dependent Lon protease
VQHRPALTALLIRGETSVQGAHRALIPTENKRNLLEVPADVIDRADPVFYSDPLTAALKALGLK